jgi:hypothetical protein
MLLHMVKSPCCLNFTSHRAAGGGTLYHVHDAFWGDIDIDNGATVNGPVVARLTSRRGVKAGFFKQYVRFSLRFPRVAYLRLKY